MIAGMRDRVIAGQNLKAGMTTVDQKTGDPLLWPMRRVINAGRHKNDEEIGMVAT